MRVEIFADIVCPWCYIGERRFENALAQFQAREEVDVVYRPFQLDAGAPQRARPLSDYLAARFGQLAGSMTAQVGRVAAEEGIAIDWHRALAVNTRTAHRLMQLARSEYDRSVQQRLLESLFAAHFEHGADISDHSVLQRLAVAAGMAQERAQRFLAQHEGEQQLEQELAHARELGVQSVPLFLFEEQYVVEGAQPTETFLQVLEEVRRRSLQGAGSHS